MLSPWAGPMTPDRIVGRPYQADAMSAAADRAAAERAKLNEVMVVAAAESTITNARIAELVEAQRAARARWAAAKGQLTRAMKTAAPRRSLPPATGNGRLRRVR
jgi:aspartokinase